MRERTEHRRFLGWGIRQRTLLLLLVTFGWSIALLYKVALAARGGTGYRDCLSEAGFDPGSAVDRMRLEIPVPHGTYAPCFYEVGSEAAMIGVIGAGCVLLAGLVRYVALAFFGGVDDGDEVIDAETRSRLSDLVLRAGLGGKEPRFIIDTGMPLISADGVGFPGSEPEFADVRWADLDARAFRQGGRLHVSLSADLVRVQRQHPDVFDAVVLHELAHVRSRDVDSAEGVCIIWRVFLAAVLLPFCGLQIWSLCRGLALGPDSELWPGDPASPVRELVLAVAIALVGQLIHSGVLRSIELVADHDAVVSGASPRAWQVLYGGTLRQRDRITEVLAAHPAGARRTWWLTRSGSLDANHGKVLPNLLATSAAILLVTEGQDLAMLGHAWTTIFITVGALVILIMLALANGISTSSRYSR